MQNMIGIKMKNSRMMSAVGFLHFLLILATNIDRSFTMNSPPLMRKQPPSNELLFTVASQSGDRQRPFILECEAEGEPTPKYRWIKNGKPFDYQSYDDRISQQPGRGTLVISNPRNEDSGQYQCFAENSLGTAISNSVFVRKAELNSFKNSDEEKTYKAVLGKPFKLECQPPGGWPKPHIYWLIRRNDNSMKTINDSRVTLDPEGNLYFSNITLNDTSDEGFYYVCAVNSVHRNEFKLGSKVYIMVMHTQVSSTQNRHPPVEQYVSRRNEIAYRGKTLELYCIYGGTPLPNVVWSKSGSSLQYSKRVLVENYGRTLKIKHVTDEDKGSYTCSVSNGVGEQLTYSIDVKVLATPYFTVEPKISNSAEGETVSFTCKADGNPEPQIKWIFNGKPISEAPYNPRREVYANEIIIRDLETNDTANYGCNATNSLGYVYKDVYVNVLALPPEIHEAPLNETVVDEQTVRMVCRVFGAPTPEVKWFRGGTELTGGRYTVLSTGDLEIVRVTFNDAGVYQCRATNRFGSTEAYGTLTVKRHTEIVKKPQNYEVTAGNQATFRCNALADPSLELEINWYANDKPINSETEPRFIKSSDSSLTISKTIELDSGTYTCEASTRYDKERSSAFLIVQDVPNAPHLESVQCSGNDASIRWNPMGDNRAPITHYTIQYNTSFTPDSWEVAYELVPSTDTTYNVAISPWANYTFRIIAWNKIGQSAPSKHSSTVCTTEPEVPHKNPHNVKGMGSAPDNLVISWTPMPEIEHNGRGFQYRVSWKLNVPYANWTIEDVPNWKQSELVIENQLTYSQYRITVIAMNEKGVSDVAPNEVIGYSGQDVPQQAPLNFTLVQVASNTTAVVRWTNVDASTVRGPLRGYKVQHWTDEDMTKGLNEIIFMESTSRALITNLVPFTRNYARVLVFNDRYNGPASNTITIDTPEGVPDAVQSLMAYQNGASSLYLTWKRPEQPNGNLTGYKIYYQEVDGTKVGPLMERRGQISDANRTDAKLAGLRPDTKYRIHVKASTRAGEGVGNFVETRTAAKNAVHAPDTPDFRIEKLQSETGFPKILITWLPNYNTNPGSYFLVKYRLDGETQFSQTEPETNENFMIIKDLLPDKVYEIVTISIDGEYSTESLPQTLDTYSTDGPIIQLSENVASAGWFIGLVLAIAFLLLAFTLVCVMKRNRGGKYAVHEREQANGRHDYGDEDVFREYTQPLDNKSYGRNSMNVEPKMGLESDTDSMAEYGDGDTEGMNEDGSFIGQYGPHRKANEPSHGFTTLV